MKQKITNGLIFNKITGKTNLIKAEPTAKIMEILSKMF